MWCPAVHSCEPGHLHIRGFARILATRAILTLAAKGPALCHMPLMPPLLEMPRHVAGAESVCACAGSNGAHRARADGVKVDLAHCAQPAAQLSRYGGQPCQQRDACLLASWSCHAEHLAAQPLCSPSQRFNAAYDNGVFAEQHTFCPLLQRAAACALCGCAHLIGSSSHVHWKPLSEGASDSKACHTRCKQLCCPVLSAEPRVPVPLPICPTSVPRSCNDSIPLRSHLPVNCPCRHAQGAAGAPSGLTLPLGLALDCMTGA